MVLPGLSSYLSQSTGVVRLRHMRCAALDAASGWLADCLLVSKALPLVVKCVLMEQCSSLRPRSIRGFVILVMPIGLG
jgi:hypothetical protein